MQKKVLKATAIVFILSLVAKMIGFVKSIIQASSFGATIYTDAYSVTNGFVSNILYMFTTAIAVAFVPLYVQHKKKSSDGETQVFATRTITLLCIFSVLMTIALILITPLIISVIAPTYSGEIRSIAIQYFRILLFGFSFSLVANLFTNLLNAEKIYGFSSYGSIINSIVLIMFILLFSTKIGVWSLVISIPVSYFVQWIVLYCKGRKFASISLKYGLKDNNLIILVSQATPILISQATVEINQVVDRALLSSVETGALTAVSYSAVLYQFVTTLVTTPLSTVIFTELSEAGATNNHESIKKILLECYKALLLICIPTIIVMYVCSFDIVDIVYGHGKYSFESVVQSSIGLAMYGFCLLPVCIKTVLSRAYYAVNDTKRPMFMGIFEVVINIGLSIVLAQYFGIKGVVGATAIASFILIIVMMVDYNITYIKVITKNSLFGCWKLLLSTVVSLVLMICLKKYSIVNSFFDFIIKTIIEFAIFYIILIITKDETLNLIVSSVCKRIGVKK